MSGRDSHEPVPTCGAGRASGSPRSTESEDEMALFTSKKRWQDMTQKQQISIVVMGVVQAALLAAALVDIHQRSEKELTASKRTWTMIAFINYVGPIAYFLFGRKE
jgi:hypothetical protein